jgi:hypothetical protein
VKPAGVKMAMAKKMAQLMKESHQTSESIGRRSNGEESQ